MMDILWAPWRSKYIEGFSEEEKTGKEKPCFFCEAIEGVGRERELLVVARRENCFVMLNKFPYNGGHLLIAPYRHIGLMEDLTNDEMMGIMQTLQESIKVLKAISSPHGFNVGANLGRVSGAGVPGHLHFHIVPRWDGDTSAIAVISDTKVISQSLDELQQIFAAEFAKQ